MTAFRSWLGRVVCGGVAVRFGVLGLVWGCVVYSVCHLDTAANAQRAAVAGLVVGVPSGVVLHALVGSEHHYTHLAADHVEAIAAGLAERHNHLLTLQSGARMSRVDLLPPEARTAPAKVTSCCAEHGGPDQDGDGLCDANPGMWEQPGLRETRFWVDGQTRFVYVLRYLTPDQSAVTVEVYYDLECDGDAFGWGKTVYLEADKRARVSPIFGIETYCSECGM